MLMYWSAAIYFCYVILYTSFSIVSSPSLCSSQRTPSDHGNQGTTDMLYCVCEYRYRYMKLTMFLGMSPSEHQFYVLHISVSMLSCHLECDLLLEAFSHTSSSLALQPSVGFYLLIQVSPSSSILSCLFPVFFFLISN